MIDPNAPLTQLLKLWAAGDQDALNQLTPFIHQRLKAIARARLSGEGAKTLQPTELVNEAFIRLIEADVDWRNRAHFLAIAARMIRRILVDRARARLSEKRGGGERVLTLNSQNVGEMSQNIDVLDLEMALEQLSNEDARKVEIVELHYFGGLTYAEIAEVLSLSRVTVRRDLTMARAWLLARMSD